MKYFGMLLLLFCISCNHKYSTKVFVIQPFSDFSPQNAAVVFNKIRQINPNTVIKPAMALPSAAYYPKRNRYRADSLLKFLNKYDGDTVVAGLTTKDISTTKNNIEDWGIMGLGYRPGNACVISSFRLAKANAADQFYKVVVHELGHTAGLPHCSNPHCFMRDANGGNHLNEETDFCPTCKAFLRNEGWVLK